MEYYHIKKEFKTAWQKKILQWYSKNKRDLPWRQKKNQQFYNIWISEVMLQQTTVKTVIPYYDKFLKKWPRNFRGHTIQGQEPRSELDPREHWIQRLEHFLQTTTPHKT